MANAASRGGWETPGGICRDLFGMGLLYQLWAHISEIPPTSAPFFENSASSRRRIIRHGQHPARQRHDRAHASSDRHSARAPPQIVRPRVQPDTSDPLRHEPGILAVRTPSSPLRSLNKCGVLFGSDQTTWPQPLQFRPVAQSGT